MKPLLFLIGVCGISSGLLLLTTPAAEAEAATTLQKRVEQAVEQTLQRFAARNLQTNHLAATVLDLTAPQRLERGSFRGDVQIYPASVIKLFYLVAAHRWMEDGKLEETDELRRAMRDMIVDSSNEATHYIVDLLTDTTSGPELSTSEMERWYEKRNAVNRYFAALGYANINVNRKPWCEGPYGREMQSIKLHKPNHRNWLTTDATARLLAEIVTGKAISARRSAEMLKLMERDPFKPAVDPDDQAHGFTGPAVPQGAKLWSKAGWTSETRHDAAYVELPDGRKLVLVIFTTNHANNREIIPFFARQIIGP
ncbi:MAG: serine hydrolase [Verrucomicrobiota bacterium]